MFHSEGEMSDDEHHMLILLVSLLFCTVLVPEYIYLIITRLLPTLTSKQFCSSLSIQDEKSDTPPLIKECKS